MFKKFVQNERTVNRMIPILAVLMGFLVGCIIMLLTGQDPLVLFKSLIRAVFGINVNNIGTGRSVFTIRAVGEYFVYVMPIVLTGLSVAFAFRTGLFNIGAEGQVLMGSMAAAVIGVSVDLPKPILLPMVVLGGAMAGALWGFIPGFLKAKYNVHEVVVTIMLNYAALYTTNFIQKSLPGSTANETVPLHEGALLKSDFLAGLTGNSRFNWGFILVILALIAFSYIINKTTFGYELKAVGFNQHAARYAGMNVQRNAALSMAISGAFSGLAGVLIVAGTFGRGRILASFENYGFDGIAVALIGGNTAIGSLFSGFLMGALNASQPIIEAQRVPNAIAVIIMSTIIMFVAMKQGFKRLIEKPRGEK